MSKQTEQEKGWEFQVHLLVRGLATEKKSALIELIRKEREEAYRLGRKEKKGEIIKMLHEDGNHIGANLVARDTGSLAN
jgi:hypothetical protein